MPTKASPILYTKAIPVCRLRCVYAYDSNFMIRVLIVDDQQFVRDALRSFLSVQEPDWQLSEAANGNARRLSCSATPRPTWSCSTLSWKG